MNTTLLAGTIIVNFALLAYAIAVVTEQWRRKLSLQVALCLALGIVLDVTATLLMILGSSNGPLTLHGVLGYSALVAMFVDTVVVVRYWMKNGNGCVPTRAIHIYTRCAFLWWLFAYLAGAALVMMKHH